MTQGSSAIAKMKRNKFEDHVVTEFFLSSWQRLTGFLPPGGFPPRFSPEKCYRVVTGFYSGRTRLYNGFHQFDSISLVMTIKWKLLIPCSIKRNGFYENFKGFDRVLLGFMSHYWVLPSFSLVESNSARFTEVSTDAAEIIFDFLSSTDQVDRVFWSDQEGLSIACHQVFTEEQSSGGSRALIGRRAGTNRWRGG